MPHSFQHENILRLIQHSHCKPIEREIAGIVASNIRDADTEISIGEVTTGPGAAPRIGCAAEQVGGFARGQRRRGFDCRPCPATVP